MFYMKLLIRWNLVFPDKEILTFSALFMFSLYFNVVSRWCIYFYLKSFFNQWREYRNSKRINSTGLSSTARLCTVSFKKVFLSKIIILHSVSKEIIIIFGSIYI